ncbi:BTAD domain-containing putative transcriptional regulator [Amycolatopsis rhizosphaerae]|uniref:BTAD domain-containing putative transcriptional regulator n=1 Tax=Amycolatopsis rhizosphaerae TaxID=2053003 RepID=UPI0016438A4D|nr:BTAD domain-containing putative transcriptional regulator [Amycolatopsis rhizosphaerae]
MWFGILGATRALAEDGSELPLGGPRPRALLARLLLDAGRVVGTDSLLDALYGEDLPREAANALQAQVSRLRRVLGGGRLERHPAGYRLAVDPADVDLHRFLALSGEGRRALAAGERERAAGLLREALALWRGPALADVTAPFAEPQAARLAESRVAAVEDLAEAELSLARAKEVVAELEKLAEDHPIRERLHALLVRALSASGRQTEALAAFERVRRRLADELGSDPSPELAAAHLAVLRSEPVRVRGLPAQLTSFVGREEELARIGELLAGRRLVTLTGPGGAGKTRLAIEASGRQNGEACFVDLAPLRDGGALPQAVLDALGLRESALFGAPGQAGAAERITAALADRRLLLVFDNCEHVIAEAAALVHRLLTGCPGLRVIATSREPLGITGEALYPVPPLPASSATRLFLDRAATVSEPVTEAGTDTVARICAALDGLPLAIELAAARLRTIPLPRLEDRLDDRFRLLSRGSRTAAPRQQTLRAVVGWSWDLLGEDEQRLLRRLAVFAGGTTAEAAALVCGVSEVDAEDLLAGLAEKSLVEPANGRYRLLETIRAYAAERLGEAGERDGLARAHAEYFLDLARTAEPFLRRAEQLAWLARLTAEHANLHAALHWAVDADPGLALRLLGVMSSYWRLRGVISEVTPLAARLLERLGPRVPEGLEEEYVLTVLATGPSEVDGHRRRAGQVMRTLRGPVRLPHLLVAWALFAGPPEPGEPLSPLNQQFATTDDPWFQALAQFSLSYLQVFNGNPAAAEPQFGAALELFRSVGDRWGMAQVLDGLATVTELGGNREHAVALTDEAIALVGQLGAIEELAELWGRQALRLRCTDPEAARADFERSAELAHRAGVPAVLALAHLGLGDLERWGGRLAEARRRYEQALGECGTDWQSRGARSRILTALGRLEQAEGRRAPARDHHRAAIEIAAENQIHTDLVEATGGAAGLLLLEGNPAAAARLLGISVALRGAPLPDDPDVRSLKELLGTSHEREFAEGLAMDREAATAHLHHLFP